MLIQHSNVNEYPVFYLRTLSCPSSSRPEYWLHNAIVCVTVCLIDNRANSLFSLQGLDWDKSSEVRSTDLTHGLELRFLAHTSAATGLDPLGLPGNRNNGLCARGGTAPWWHRNPTPESKQEWGGFVPHSWTPEVIQKYYHSTFFVYLLLLHWVPRIAER